MTRDAAMGDSATAVPYEMLGQIALPLILFVVGVLLVGRCREYQRLAHFKGPPTAGISWWWHSRAVIGGQAHKYYGEVCEKYGVVARIGTLAHKHRVLGL